jgi:DNA-binding CsgD family transcriptional regulator
MRKPQQGQSACGETVSSVATDGPSSAILRDPLESDEYILPLLQFGQVLRRNSQRIGHLLIQQVSTVTHNRAQLVLNGLQPQSQAYELVKNEFVRFPVQCDQRIYGRLSVPPDPVDHNRPALSFNLAHLLAEVCSLILYSSEEMAFLRGQISQLSGTVPQRLTNREQQVLNLMGRGYCQKEIAALLCIATSTLCVHQRNIYRRLGVRNKYEALLVAYQAGLLTFID